MSKNKTRRRTALIASAVLLGSLLAGCGHDSNSPSSTAPSGATARYQAALDFAQCMRSNGDPNFPDPELNGGKVKLKLDLGSAEAQKAYAACKDKMPQANTNVNGGKIDPAKLAAWMKCLRANGVPKLPDPDVSGTNISFDLRNGPGVNGNDMQKAQDACSSQFPGGSVSTQFGK